MKKELSLRDLRADQTKDKIICLNCRAYTKHSTGRCPFKKCEECGKDGHLKQDCLTLQKVSKDYLSHLVTYNVLFDHEQAQKELDEMLKSQSRVELNNNDVLPVYPEWPEWPIR